MLISIIIPNHNRHSNTNTLVSYLDKQREKKNLPMEIIVVDYNNPNLIENYNGARVISVNSFPNKSDDAFSLAHARNIGAKHAKGDWYVFLDCDLTPQQNTIPSIVKSIRDENTLYYGTRIKLTHQLSPISNVTEPWGYCLILHKDRFNDLNGFNEGYKGWGGEDTEFVERVTKMGMTKQPISNCLFYHYWHEECTWHCNEDKQLSPLKENGYTLMQITEFEYDREKYLREIKDLKDITIEQLKTINDLKIDIRDKTDAIDHLNMECEELKEDLEEMARKWIKKEQEFNKGMDFIEETLKDRDKYLQKVTEIEAKEKIIGGIQPPPVVDLGPRFVIKESKTKKNWLQKLFGY